ncbi:perforin-1-like [Discoglossus pictus]
MKSTRSSLLDLEKVLGPDNKCKLCQNPHKGKEWQKLPTAMLDWKPISECTKSLTSSISNSDTSIADSMTDQIKNDWQAGLGIRYKTLSYKMAMAGSESAFVHFSKSKSAKDQYSFVQSQLNCEFYSFHLSKEANLTNNFQKDLHRLPAAYNRKTKSAYQKFILRYGTHYITQATVGGKLQELTAVRTCEAAINGQSIRDVQNCLSVESETSLTLPTKSFDINNKGNQCIQTARQKMKKGSFHDAFSEKTSEVKGGNITGDLLSFNGKSGGNSASFSYWMESLKTQPAPVTYSLESIHTLAKYKSSLQGSLKKAIKEYIREKALQKTCKCPGKKQSKGDCSCSCRVTKQISKECCPKGRGLGVLKVLIKRGKGLYGDFWGKTDGYVIVKVDRNDHRTATIKDNDNPKWNEWMNFGNVDLKFLSSMYMEVWDKDPFNDELLGSCTVQLSTGKGEEWCRLKHGSVSFSINLTCAPHLTGDTCEEYAPSNS